MNSTVLDATPENGGALQVVIPGTIDQLIVGDIRRVVSSRHSTDVDLGVDSLAASIEAALDALAQSIIDIVSGTDLDDQARAALDAWLDFLSQSILGLREAIGLLGLRESLDLHYPEGDDIPAVAHDLKILRATLDALTDRFGKLSEEIHKLGQQQHHKNHVRPNESEIQPLPPVPPPDSV